MNKMQQKSHTAINKLALVLLSLVVLELFLIGDQVESIKTLKKKVYLKKLKKLLPILALMKPKKKIILLPIPIPMMQHGAKPPNRPGAAHRPYSPYPASGGLPMSFIMMTQPGQMSPETLSMAMMEGGMMDAGPKLEPQEEQLQNLRQKEQVMSMVVPSMTMTIQSEGGGHSAIELSTNLMGSSPVKNHSDFVAQPIQQQKQEVGMLKLQPVQPPYPSQHTYSDNIGPVHDSAGRGDQYYSSPWVTAKTPLPSPMKLMRKDRQREQPTTPRTPTTSPPVPRSLHQGFPVQEHIELEDLIAVGPAQLRPFIQDSSGRLHMQPTHLMSASLPNNWRPSTTEVEESDEVQTVASEPPVHPKVPPRSGQNRQVKGYSSGQHSTKNLQRPYYKSPSPNP